MRQEADGAEPPARFFGRRPKLQSPNEALQPELPPPPPSPHRRRPTLSALSGFLSFLLLLAFAGLFAVVWGAHRLQQPGPLPADKVLYIQPGTEVADIVAQLDEEGMIDSPLIFNIALLLEGDRSKVKAGEYLIHERASMREVMDTLVSGRQILHSVTIPEGLTSQEVVDRLRHNDLLMGDIREIPPEGSLLPETYRIARGMPRADLIRLMEEDERKLVAQIWAQRSPDLLLSSPYEMVTLASIVERETGKADERPHVASVFLNRLRKHMRLQSDPTIVYGIMGGRGSLGRPLTRADVEQASPYNTYVIEGLPPGPIANPGRAALEAVANPSRTADLYFVADGTGGHVFAATLEEHQRNVARWRQIEKDAKDKAGSDIDKYVPATGHDQHSDASGSSVYGALPSSFTAPDSASPANMNAYAPSLGVGAAAAAISQIAPAMPRAAPAAAADPVVADSIAPQPAAQKTAANYGPSLDDLGITVRGMDQPASAKKLLDGPVDSSASVAPADPKAFPDAAVAGPANGRQPPAHPHIYDASEGTPLDPLRNTTYDLNYAKTVPPPSALK
ncbi:endolytic transglycosylase MltG [uncultured Methylovirgula sp.]|uniref:endolytic transglycosylase MltG n=1 Tax=uncultured Methylovirgula sp. TaxID=1285960 RepID=UPI002637394A|nr:endolytic transglycosylase MltG [uncultured Methylovirgula sp.]